MQARRWIVLAVRFLLEIGMLVGLGYWGFETGEDTVGKVAAGVGAPIAVAVVWGTFVAPRALRPVPVPVRLIVEFFLFGFTALALADVGQPVLGGAFGVAAIGVSLLNAAGEIGLRDSP